MSSFLHAVSRINLFLAFIVLFGAHVLMYYLLRTDDWVMVALSAALVETALLAGIQLYAAYRLKGRAK